jgi:hypothetical protein
MYQLFYSKQRRKETTETHLLVREVTVAGGDANDEHVKDGEGGAVDDGAVACSLRGSLVGAYWGCQTTCVLV